MSAQNDGGPAFPQHGWTSNPEVLERMKDQGGMTLLDWFASHETLSDFDHPETSGPPIKVAELLAGPAPNRDNGNTIARYKWEALWRAKLKYIRANAMLKARER